MDLVAGRSYQLRVENVVTLPPIEEFDNTLFPNVSGLRIGLALQQGEQEIMNRAVACAQDSDLAVLLVGHNKDSEGEGGDRPDMQLPGRSNELIQAVCKANPNTVVVIQSASAVTMPWVDDARAIVMAWYQGQENGNALADALLGHCNFSGKTPITFPSRIEDHGSNAWFPGEAANDHCMFGEGILVGYRHFDAYSITPLWPFGYGLSYTRFSVSQISLRAPEEGSRSSHVTSVHARVANIGQRDGQDVVQAYVTPSAEILENGLTSYHKTLAGYCKVSVSAGEERAVTIDIGREELRWYDEKSRRWRIDSGMYRCFVGTSSRDILAELEFEVV